MIKGKKHATQEQNSAASSALSLTEIISALSFALDLTEGAVPGHAMRSCLLGMRLADEIGHADSVRVDLHPALLLKDVGCSSNAARMCQIVGGDDRAIKAAVKFEDWTQPHKASLAMMRTMWKTALPGAGPIRKIIRIFRIGATQHVNNEAMIQLRCDRGASIMRKIGMSEQVAAAVHSLDEHWDGSGYPQGIKGHAISPLARIMAVAQHLDAFALDRGAEKAMQVLRERSGRWFDPEIVKAAESLHRRNRLWQDCLPEGTDAAAMEQRTRAAVLESAPGESADLSPSHIDTICEAFAEVVDAKSPFTFRHSIGVTDAARLIGTAMGLSPERLQFLNRAALLHDLGKLRVPNSILDKPGKLTDEERTLMQEHSGITRLILGRIKPFKELAQIAGAHHEKLDGTGYPEHLVAMDLPLEARILAVADIYGALTEDRPYRAGFPIEKVLAIMSPDAPRKLDGDCFDALCSVVENGSPAAPSPHPEDVNSPPSSADRTSSGLLPQSPELSHV